MVAAEADREIVERAGLETPRARQHGKKLASVEIRGLGQHKGAKDARCG